MKRLSIVLIAAALVCAESRSSITQYGITWTFDKAYECGQFATGDWWAVGPVVVTAIDPPSTNAGGRTINGSMANPPVNGGQAFDSEMPYNTYHDSLNAARQLPLTLNPGSSLLSTISHDTAGERPQLTDAAVLTVLDSEPPVGSFRPPYVGDDKTLSGAVSDLNGAILNDYPTVANMPNIDQYKNAIQRPWIEMKGSWSGRYLHPSNNQPDYGREICRTMGKALLLLHLDIDPADKDTLFWRLIQFGIDVYGAARLGCVWTDDGGHNPGRKMPMILAGMALNNSDILEYADASEHFIFQEDRQTFYVTQDDVGRTLYTDDGRPREEYRQEHVGLAEWGEKHTSQPMRDGSNWNAYYRTIVGGAVIGHALTAIMMGAQDIWNWPAFFDYMDRYYSIEGPNAANSTNSIQLFERDMWEAYRDSVSIEAGAKDIPSEFYISVYPNPFNSAVCVSVSGCKGGSRPAHTSDIRIYATNGRLVAQWNNRNQITWNAQALPAGIYLVKAKMDDRIYSRKIILTR